MTGRPTFRLMGAAEIGKRLGGVSRERVYQITQRRTFPEPYQRLAMGFVWLAVDVEEWIRERRPELAEDSEGE
jgi:predicted DNA-binding transcriptional regulator AlpA